ncbi:hypothetical protein [Thiobacter aerophilum]|uniref:Uncharacterized protein n=1 Tax=Thiobacter aerophilum TaxID=3121275 RepID=A0ABV0EFD3_9BURK
MAELPFDALDRCVCEVPVNSLADQLERLEALVGRKVCLPFAGDCEQSPQALTSFVFFPAVLDRCDWP